jgi:hypothetical protein
LFTIIVVIVGEKNCSRAVPIMFLNGRCAERRFRCIKWLMTSKDAGGGKAWVGRRRDKYRAVGN